VACRIKDDDAANHQKIRFLIEMSNGELDKIVSCSELSNVIEDQHNNREINEPKSMSWAFKAITEHQGPLKANDPRCKGSSYSVLVHWEDGSETFEPLTVMAKADPLTCALHAKDHMTSLMFQSIFGESPKEHTSPVDKDDHLELDSTEDANPESFGHLRHSSQAKS
jgi:hypothetical protein